MAEGTVEARATSTIQQSFDRGAAWRARSRWAVHLGLLFSAAASLASLQLLHVRFAYHTVVGLLFVGLVIVHSFQRRQTIARMATQLIRSRTFLTRSVRLTVSDLILFFITLNVLVSGVVDWGHGSPTRLPLPMPFDRWHADSAAALVICLVVHVIRRRNRLRRSKIR
jgi:L-asparagine transporter-like permease